MNVLIIFTFMFSFLSFWKDYLESSWHFASLTSLLLCLFSFIALVVNVVIFFNSDKNILNQIKLNFYKFLLLDHFDDYMGKLCASGRGIYCNQSSVECCEHNGGLTHFLTRLNRLVVCNEAYNGDHTYYCDYFFNHKSLKLKFESKDLLKWKGNILADHYLYDDGWFCDGEKMRFFEELKPKINEDLTANNLLFLLELLRFSDERVGTIKFGFDVNFKMVTRRETHRDFTDFVFKTTQVRDRIRFDVHKIGEKLTINDFCCLVKNEPNNEPHFLNSLFSDCGLGLDNLKCPVIHFKINNLNCSLDKNAVSTYYKGELISRRAYDFKLNHYLKFHECLRIWQGDPDKGILVDGFQPKKPRRGATILHCENIFNIANFCLENYSLNSTYLPNKKYYVEGGFEMSLMEETMKGLIGETNLKTLLRILQFRLKEEMVVKIFPCIMNLNSQINISRKMFKCKTDKLISKHQLDRVLVDVNYFLELIGFGSITYIDKKIPISREVVEFARSHCKLEKSTKKHCINGVVDNLNCKDKVKEKFMKEKSNFKVIAKLDKKSGQNYLESIKKQASEHKNIVNERYKIALMSKAKDSEKSNNVRDNFLSNLFLYQAYKTDIEKSKKDKNKLREVIKDKILARDKNKSSVEKLNKKVENKITRMEAKFEVAKSKLGNPLILTKLQNKRIIDSVLNDGNFYPKMFNKFDFLSKISDADPKLIGGEKHCLNNYSEIKPYSIYKDKLQKKKEKEGREKEERINQERLISEERCRMFEEIRRKSDEVSRKEKEAEEQKKLQYDGVFESELVKKRFNVSKPFNNIVTLFRKDKSGLCLKLKRMLREKEDLEAYKIIEPYMIKEIEEYKINSRSERKAKKGEKSGV